MIEKQFAVAAGRNAQPILEVLQWEFRRCTAVLEIGSGTGQHAVAFAAVLDHLDWQTSDLDENHAAIGAAIENAGLANVHAPLSIDVRTAGVALDTYDGVFSSNTAHIMSSGSVADMMRVAAEALRPDGIFCLYGPFKKGGRFNTASNEQFDRGLRGRDPDMGLRDLETLDELGARHGLKRTSLYAMPSNNLIVVWTKSEE